MANAKSSRTIAGISILDSQIAQDAVALARGASSRMLFNHVMRSYLFGKLDHR